MLRSLPILLAAFPLAAQAQVPAPAPGYIVTSWTTAQGLPQSAIYGLARDHDGYLWVGTAAGLARFDGDTFVTYPRGTAQGQPAYGLATDRRGVIWVATPDSGMQALDQSWSLQRMTDPVPAPPMAFAVASSESLWMANVSTIWRAHDGAWQKVDAASGGVGLVRAMLVDSSGTLWIAGVRGLLRVAPGGIVQRIAHFDCADVLALAPAGGGDVWAGTCTGLVHVSAAGAVNPVVLDGMGPTRVRSLLAASDGNLWLGDDRGAHRLELTRDGTSTWLARRTFTDPLALERAAVVVLSEGADGSIWAGTDGAGLRLLTPLHVSRITLSDGLPQRTAHHLAPDGMNGLWISGGCTGLARWRDGRATGVSSPTGPPRGPCVTGLLRARSGILWVGGTGKLFRADSSGRRLDVVWHRDLPLADVAPMLEDRAGRVWFGTGNGVLGFVAPGGAVTVLPDSTLSAGQVWSMVEDSTGFWVGQVGEVTRIVNDRVVARMGAADGIPPGPLRDLQFDAAGDLWIASYGGGLARYRPGGAVQQLASRGRRFEQALSAIAIDRRDRFWFLGDGGLTMVDGAELGAAIDSGRPLRMAIDLGLADGVPEGNGGFPNHWVDTTSDRLWVATVDGVVAVDMQRFPVDTIMPPVRVEDIRVDGTLVATRDSLFMPTGTSALEVHFTAPSFRGRDGMQFRYRLRGHDLGWIDGGSARVARYAGIAPGTYAFELVGGGRDGRETAALTLPVVVEAAWWQAPLARSLLLLLALLLLYLLYLLLTGNMRARTLALQHEIEVRERAEAHAAAAASDLAHVSRLATAGELAASIAHELNQPLSAVVGSASTARRLVASQDSAALMAVLDDIVNESNRAADVIRTLRAFVLNRQPVEKTVSIDVVVSDTLRLLRQELRARSVSVRVVDEQRQPSFIRGDPVQLQQVLVNLLLNAADAMAGLGVGERKVTVLLRCDDERTVRVSVFDVGAGMSEELLARVFEPFFTTKKNGLGLGLSLSRSIVEGLGGRLWAESPGGSAFHLVLPRSQA